MYDILSTGDDSQSESIINYLGYLEGVPVATSMVCLDGSVAGLWWVSTLPMARGKGIGTEMTLYPIREARQQGYRVGVLLATEMGYPLYKKLGYDDYYKTKTYVWVG
jgi:GNAT superfamily N-acetyltransferase